ncbi:hypothetical protein [Shivajiella indica]|uniref:Uncharacterized protein n=1 Tax=Shivajiella indica TaxID=872115 RepID=A0ABW5BC65_9BACT
MMNLNKILTIGAGAVLMLSSCSTSYNAMKSGESDDLYFMASDNRVATQFAVENNNPQNFQSLNSVRPNEFEQESFSARNVNPEYIAKYQSQANTEDTGTVYFDDNATQESTPNVNVYNNFYGSSVNPNGFPQSNFNLSLGFGFGAPMWGMGWGMPMWGMGMWDPFWGMPMWGMRPGWGMGFGWNSMWGWNMSFGFGMGWGMPMWGNPWMNPWMGGGMWGWGMRPGWGWGPPVVIIPPGGEGGRDIVRGGRPGRGAGTAVSGPRGGTDSYAATTRAARREATSGNRGISEGTRGSSRDFSASQNEYNSARSRVANTSASANPGYRNTGSAAATRPSSRTGVANTRPSYNTGTNTRSAYGTAPSRGTTAPGTINRSTGTTRGSSPSYNRGNTGGTFNNTRTAPSRNSYSTPSRGGMSTPSRSSGGSFGAPSRSSGGGFSSGGMSGGSRGGGGMSSGGSRGGRGN